MTTNGLRWMRLCLATGLTTLVGGLCAEARASHTHVLQPGETLSAIARKYHTSIRDIVAANHVANPDSVPDYTKLTIPDAPKRTVVASTTHRFVQVKGDSVSVRLGPGESARRTTFLYAGASVLITAEREDWAQVRMDNGSSGWVRRDFLTGGKAVKAEKTHVAKAEKAPVNVAKHTKQVAQATHKVKAKHHEEEARSERLARSERKQRARQKEERLAKAKKRAKHHAEQVARRDSERQERRRQIARVRRPEAEAPEAGNDVVRTAYAYRGTPYRYGGAARGGFDCSGFTSYLYARKGVSLPHSARGQFATGKKVDRANMKPGDLVFFHTVTPGISHVGMYVGNGKFVHASSRRAGGVRVDSLDSGYYRERFRGARRVR